MVATELLRQLPPRLPFSSMTVGSGGDDGDHCCQCDKEDSGFIMMIMVIVIVLAWCWWPVNY